MCTRGKTEVQQKQWKYHVRPALNGVVKYFYGLLFSSEYRKNFCILYNIYAHSY